MRALLSKRAKQLLAYPQGRRQLMRAVTAKGPASQVKAGAFIVREVLRPL